jgi:hypothetical protein
MLTAARRVDVRGERGVAIVLFALLLPVMLALGAVVISIGSWYTHARHLQTKVDASALAGGDVWSFPCVETAPVGQPTSSQKIINTARQYVGQHTEADGTPYTSTTFNPQVGHVGYNRIHVVLNGTGFWADNASPSDFNDPGTPGSTTDPGTHGATTVCASNHLDVKATEDDSPNLFRYLPFTPDINRKARVQINQIEGINGLLPIGVRVPKPVSTAAVFYDETNGTILGGSNGIKYFCELKSPPPGFGVPSGLGAWTTYNTSDPACAYTSTSFSDSVPVTDHTGVVVATSFRPRCDATASPPITTNCLSSSFTNVDSFCQQGSGRIAQCYYVTGSGASQTTQSGLQYIRGYTNRTVTNGGVQPNAWSTPPQVNGASLDGPSANCGGFYTATSAYFNDPNQACTATLNADIDFGNALDQNLHPGAGAQVKYGQVYGTTVANGDEDCAPPGGGQSFTGGNKVPNCDMTVSGSGASGSVWLDPHFNNQGDPQGIRHAFVVMIQLKNTTIGAPGPGQLSCGNNFGATCEWFYWGDSGAQDQGSWPPKAQVDTLVFNNPLQRSFTGDPDSNGSIGWLRLSAEKTCGDLSTFQIDGPAASQTIGSHCFYVDMGLKGALAQDQGEPAFGFNTKGSQSGSVDCDPNLSQWKEETEQGCSPFYRGNDFSHDPPCPWPDGTPRNWNQFTGLQGSVWQPSPWPPYDCLLTGGPPAAGQVDNGLKGRIFSPLSEVLQLNFSTGEKATKCPTDSATDFVRGRNYWSDVNNASGGTYAFAKQGVGGHPNNLQEGKDPRLVTLFMTGYNSFGGNGGDVYPIVTFGSFYITGWGTVNGSNGINIDDPCPGNTVPPDMVVVKGGSGAEYIWGHFVNNVVPSATSTPDPDKLCDPSQFTPCIPVLVE